MARSIFLILGLLTAVSLSVTSARLLAVKGQPKVQPQELVLVEADSKNIQYTGRIDFTNPKRPRFWSPGVYITARFQGTACEVVVNNENFYGTSHNFVEIAVDNNAPVRIQTTGTINTIRAAEGLPEGAHTITVCKNTEAGVGYLEFVGFRCAGLLPPPPKPARKLEFIGDSITCGACSDLSDKPCGQGEWYDQQNAYLSYGPSTARRLHAQWQITAVSGIGLVHSCCDMKITMPEVFDKINPGGNAGAWDFRRYQPDIVTVCLGQNDGIQDAATFQGGYLRFLGQIRKAYPKARIVCLTSPMGDAALTAWQKTMLTRIVDRAHAGGDPNVSAFFFSRQYSHGCGGHPDVAEHQQIAQELAAYLSPLLNSPLVDR